MTEEELKALEEKLSKQQKSLEQAQKGLAYKISRANSTIEGLNEKKELVKILSESGIKNTGDLSKFLDKKPSATETKESEMDTEAIQQMIKDSIKEEIGNSMKPVSDQIESVNRNQSLQSGHKTISDALAKVGKENPYVASFFKNKSEDVVNAYVNRSQEDPDLTPEDFLKNVDTDLKQMALDSGLDIKPILKEEAPADSNKVTLDTESSHNSAEASSVTEKKDLTPQEQFTNNVQKAMEITKEQEEG